MSRELIKNALFCIAVSTSLTACQGAEDTEGSKDVQENACGITVCANPDVEDSYDVDKLPSETFNGKADAVEEVQLKIDEVSQDMVIDVLDIQDIFEEMGNKVSVDEIRAVGKLLREKPDLFEPSAIELTKRLAVTANIDGEERDLLLSGKTFAGTEVPDAVKEVIATARLNGAVAYDVNEQDDDGEGVWSPYPSITPPTGNMTFEYTEITPEVLKADIEDTDVEYNMIVGTTTATTWWGQEYKTAKYEVAKGGTGNIAAHYDEVYHEDIYARGRQGQKWANNCAILADGALHCLPAARRSEAQDLILTNPALARRDKHMLYNGHIEVSNGVVTGVEMSGRLSKLAARGKATFVDPIAVLKAWGFEISPGVRIRYGNTSKGIPVQVEDQYVIREAN